MTSKLLIQLALRTLNEMPNRACIPGIEEAPGKFASEFTSYELAAELESYLKANRGFTVILGYPDTPESYSSTSTADTWEQAVLDVAAEMRGDAPLSDGDTLDIVDVFEGTEEHGTHRGVDRSSVVRIRRTGPVLLDSDGQRLEERYTEALERANQMMYGCDLEPRSALKQAAHDIGIPYGEEMGAFVAWAEDEMFGRDDES